MVTFTSPDVAPGSYYRTRRTPFIALQDQEVVRYSSEIVPMYSDHDARIRGAHSGGNMAFEQARTHSSIDNALVERSSSSRRELQRSTDQALVRRSSSSQRDARDSIGNTPGTTYVFEEHIPADIYYNMKRTPFQGLQNSDVVGYNNEIGPAYSEHDLRIRGAQSDRQSYTDNALVERSSRRRELPSSNDRAASRRCSSCQREAQSTAGQALVKRSSSCSREYLTSGNQRADVQEYIQNDGHTKKYVIEEHIPAEYNYRTPSKRELMALDYDRQAQSDMISNSLVVPAPGSYFRTRRTPFIALQDKEVIRYNNAIVPVYSDHDIKIRGAHSGGQMPIEQASTQNSTDNALVERFSSSRRNLHGSTDQALVRRSSSSQRDARDSIGKIPGTTYVFEEHIPTDIYYNMRRTPFLGLQNSEMVGYNNEVTPVYSDHDIRIRGAHLDGQRYTDNALVERSLSSRRELKQSSDQALVRRSSSSQRDACDSSGKTRGTTYVFKEHIPADIHYNMRRTPSLGLQKSEMIGYSNEVTPAYSEHDLRIRGAQSDRQGYINNTLVERSSSSRRELQHSTDQALVRRSSPSQRDARGSFINIPGTAYVFEHIPADLYYSMRRSPFLGLQKSEMIGYSNEVTPAYSEHDLRIRGAQSDAQNYNNNALVERSSRRRELQSSNDMTESKRCSSCQIEAQSTADQVSVSRSPSCSREVQTLVNQRAGVHEYIQNDGQIKEYVIEEHIPAQYSYRTPSKREIMTLDYDRRAQSVPPKQDSPVQLIKILAEPGLLYYAPLSLRSDNLKPWPEREHPNYYDTRRAVFTEPRGSELKHYAFKIMPSESNNTRQLRSSSYDNSLDRNRRSRSHSREHAMKQQVIYEDVSSDVMQNNMSTAGNVNNEMALVPFDHSQSVPPAQREYSSKWIKIPGGPATITVYPTISSNDPSTWTNQEPLRISTYDTHKAVDSSLSNVNATVRNSSQSKKKSTHEIVTYEHFPKKDMYMENREIATDQRYDRSHSNNRGSEYRSKWVSSRSGPSPFVYSSIFSRDKEACSNPALTGYVGSTNYLEARERSKTKDENEYYETNKSSIDKSYTTKSTSSKVNRILNTKEDFDKKHVLDMLFDIKHIIKERESLGAYDIPLKLKNKMTFLTNIVQDITLKNKRSHGIGSYPTDSVKSYLAVSCLLAPIRPDHGRTNATTRFQYMLHEPRHF